MQSIIARIGNGDGLRRMTGLDGYRMPFHFRARAVVHLVTVRKINGIVWNAGVMSHHRKLTLQELAALPFIRPGDAEFDMRLAVEIWDARNRIALNEMIAAEPGKPHDSPDGLLHYIPHIPQ